MEFTIEHELPGRVRLRCPEGTFTASEAPLVAALLQRQSGFKKVTASPVTGSLLIYYEVPMRSSVLEAVRLLDRSFYEGAGIREPFRETEGGAGAFFRSIAGNMALWPFLPRSLRNSLMAFRLLSGMEIFRPSEKSSGRRTGNPAEADTSGASKN